MVDESKNISGRRDDTSEFIGGHTQLSPQSHTPSIKKLKRNNKLKISLLLLGFLVIVGIGMTGWLYLHRNTSPVPHNIAKSVNFPIYYPDQKKLPADYTLNISSFSVGNHAVVYTVKYDNNKKLIFTVQQKPSTTEIGEFYFKYMPIHNDFQTSVGKAAIGAINLQTVVSLPTNSSSWILITAPTDIDHNKLKQVVQAIKI